MTGPIDPKDWSGHLHGQRPILVTGTAGFIGYHLARHLMGAGVAVVGLDNVSPYYDIRLKQRRLADLQPRGNFTFLEIDLADRDAIAAVFDAHRPAHVVHLAAQAGVRYSLENPHAYADSNLVGFLNILEGCRHIRPAHLVYASSSSVYGGNTALPFTTHQAADHPVSLYAATKKANELMAHSYSHLYGIPATGVRFFTVYGPWGRPDMAYWKFTEAIWNGQPIDVFNDGDMARDFTHVADIVEALARLTVLPPASDPSFDRSLPDPAASWAPHRVYNIGRAQPEPLMDLIRLLEQAIGRRADIRFKPMQPGDVERTWADMADLEAMTGFRPQVGLADGLTSFVDWYRWWRENA